MYVIAQSYPWSFLATVVLPFLAIFASFFTCRAGYENLKHQYDTDKQADRIETGINSVETRLVKKLDLLETLNQQVEASGRKDAYLTGVIAQYRNIENAIKLSGFPEKSPGAANDILDIIIKDILHVDSRPELPGRPLVIGTTPNSYRVIFSVPMRVPPQVAITGIPKGTSASISDITDIGFVVTFLPYDIKVTAFGFTASAEL